MTSLLIVDDDPAIREVFSILLARSGFSVMTAPGGSECLGLLESSHPDLILLDIMMHPVDGWQTLNAIRTRPEMSGIPVMMFSGKSPSADELFRYGGWIEDYFMKPITMQAITRSLNDVFERMSVTQAERERFLQNGAELSLVEEYCALKRFLFIYGKFSLEVFGNGSDPAAAVLPQRNRMAEISRKLTTGIGLCSPSKGSGNVS